MHRLELYCIALNLDAWEINKIKYLYQCTNYLSCIAVLNVCILSHANYRVFLSSIFIVTDENRR